MNGGKIYLLSHPLIPYKSPQHTPLQTSQDSIEYGFFFFNHESNTRLWF